MALSLLLLGTAASAQPPDPRTAAALKSLEDFGAALDALRPPADYTLEQRRAVQARLAELQENVALIELPAGLVPAKTQALERFRAALSAAAAREQAFWLAQRGAEPTQRLPAATADALRADAASMRRGWEEVLPPPALTGPNGGSPPAQLQGDPQLGAMARAAERTQTHARGSIADPNAFFDAQTGEGDVAARPAPGQLPSFTAAGQGQAQAAASLLTEPPARVSDLQVGPVPAPVRERRPVAPSRGMLLLTAGVPAAHAAVDAVGENAPLVGQAARIARTAAQPAAESMSPEKAACLQASADGPVAHLCGTSSPLLLAAPAAAGFFAEIRRTFTTPGGIAGLLTSLLIGFLIPALTGGIGLIFTVLKAVLGVTAVLAVGALVYQLGRIIYDFATTDASDPRHWQAARQFGAVSAQLLVAVACILAGVSISRATGADAAIRSGLARLQERLTGVGAASAETAIAAASPGNRSSIQPPEPPPAGRTSQRRARIPREQAERSVDDLLRAEGRSVEPNPLEGAGGAGRQGDRMIDGVLTEIKSLMGVANTSADRLSGALSSRIMDGRGQAAHIIVDARSQAGMTEAVARRGVRRAYGADNQSGRKIETIRVVGRDFDIIVPRE